MSENYFYFRLPFRTDFSLHEGNILEDQQGYSRLWETIRQSNINTLKDGNQVSINFHHDSLKQDKLQFESVDKDSSLNNILSPIVLDIHPDDWFEELIKDKTDHFKKRCMASDEPEILEYVSKSCKISLFKNTISTMEFIFKLNIENKDISRDCIKKLEKWSNDFSTFMASYCNQYILHPIVEMLRGLDTKDKFFCNPGQHTGFPDVYEGGLKKRMVKRLVGCGVPLWVSRSLVIGKYDQHFDELINRWVIATQDKGEIHKKFSNPEGDEKNLVYLGWMHSMMLGDINDKVIKDSFFAIGMAQYYYAIFDSLNQNLSQIIGISHRKRSIKQTRQYKSLLEEMIFTSDLIKINFSDLTQGLQRNRAYFFRVLVRQWTIDNIMDNVQKKIALCKDNINKIYQKAFNKSQKVAELLLFFISGFAILEFLNGIAGFFYGPESINSDVWGLYNIGQIMGPNSMMWFGMLLFLLIFLVYLRLLKEKA